MTTSSDKDLGSAVKLVTAVDAQTYSDDSTDINGNGVDLVPGDNLFESVVFSVNKNNGNASDDLTFTLQESSDDGSSDAYEDVTDADGNKLTVQVTGASATSELDVTNVEHERYLRLKLKSADATLGGSNSDVTATAAKGGAKVEPV